MTSGLTRFGGPRTVVCNLGTSGSLPAHQPGVAYSGTFSVTNRVGEVTAELVSATPALPAGWSLAVNQGTGVVTLAWPAAAPVSAPPLPNLDFEAGAANWLLGNAWIIDGAGLQDGGTQAGRYRGAGQSSLRHAQAVPVTPGTTITASARISKGTTRADFGGGAVVLEWLTAAGAPLDFSVGNVVNTGTAAFQTSTVTATAPAGAGLVRLAVSATRDIKGRASDSVYVDNVTWNHTYTLPGGVNTDYAVVIRVRDGRGCQATLSQTIAQDSGDGWVAVARDNGEPSSSFAVLSSSGTDWTGSAITIRSGAETPIGLGVSGGAILLHFGSNIGVWRSTNRGSSWANASGALGFSTDANCRRIFNNRGRWFIVPTTGTLRYSDDDGTTWTASSGGQAFRATEIIAESSANTLRTMGQSGDSDRSTNNGASWTGHSTLMGFQPWCGANNGGTFVMFGAATPPIDRIARSTDFGFTFSAVTNPVAGSTFNRNCAAAIGSTFVAVTTAGQIIVSTDNGASFSLVSGYTFPSTPRQVASGGGRFIIVGDNGAIATALASSPSSWSTVPSGTFGTLTIQAIAYIPPA